MAEADDLETAPTAPAGVSSRLREARVAAGLSLADIAARTRVSERHLAAIEGGLFSSLASPTYAVGFARAYARTLGLDEKEVAASVRTEIAAGEKVAGPRVVTFEPGDPARVPSARTAWAAALAALIVIAGVFVLWRSFYSPQASLSELLPQATATPSTRAIAESRPRGGLAVPVGPVVFTAQEANIWVKFYDGSGKQLMQKQMALGESFIVPADAVDPKVWTARPDALQITVGGRPIPRLGDKPVKVKDVPVSAAALRARPAPSPGSPPAPSPAQSGAPSAAASAPAT